MKPELPKIYIDACCFSDLAGYKARVPQNDSEITRDAQCVQWTLECARNQRVRVFTSTISIAEASGLEPGVPSPPDEAKRFFDMLFLSGKSGVSLVQTIQGITIRARDIRWVSNIGLKGADSIHAATALFMKCDEIWTRDRPFLAKAPQLSQIGAFLKRPTQTKFQFLTEAQSELSLGAI